MVIVIILLLGGAGGYYWWTQKQVTTLNNELTVKTVQLAEQEQVIKDYKQQLATVQRTNTAYNNQLNAIRTKATQLQDQLNKLNLTTNAALNPREVEKEINVRFQQTFDELSKISSSVKTGGK